MSGLRLFTGIALPEVLCERLALMQGGIPEARWVSKENLHITLSFIGNVDEDTAEEAHDVLSALTAHAFSLRLQGVGNFAQGKHPQLLWAGVEKSEVLFRLQEKMQNALRAAGVPVENRKYTPHVTLARFRSPDVERLAEFLHEHAGFESEEFSVDEFILYRSHQTKNGSSYEVLERYALD